MEPEHYGIWSVLPPLLAVAAAVKTKKVFPSLFAGIWASWLVMDGGRPLHSFYDAVNSLVKVFQSEGNTKTIMFSALVGALILFVQKSGGVEGFVQSVTRYFEKKNGISKRRLQFLAMLTGIVVFVETSISSLTVGTVFRPLFDKMKISREKLAYIADSSSAPVSILIPFNAWGAFIMGLLITEGMQRPFFILMKSLVYNFYPVLALLLMAIAIRYDWLPGPMKKAEERVRQTGKLLNDDAQPMISEGLTEVEPVKGIKPRAVNMLLPLGTMILMMPVILLTTGWNAAHEKFPSESGWRFWLHALGEGSGSTAVLFAVITALIVASMMYRLQKIADFSQLNDWTIKGISGMMPLALLMMMAFGIGMVTKQLGTGVYLAQIVKGNVHPGFIPALVFALSAFIAFSTGTSWGTFAVMIPIALPLAKAFGLDIPLVLAAVLSGGVFGDHASPVSDTTIISSMAAATDHIDHVRTQLPYALTAGVLALILFLIAGFLS